MMSDPEMMRWSPSDPTFFADNTLGDWNNTMSDLKFDVNEFMTGNDDSDFYDSEMLPSDQFTSPMIDEWLHIPPVLDLKIKEEPLSPSSPSLSLPSSPESQSIISNQFSPAHDLSSSLSPVTSSSSSIVKQEPGFLITEQTCALSASQPIKTEHVVTPSSSVQHSPTIDQPCALPINQPKLPLPPNTRILTTPISSQPLSSLPLSTIPVNTAAVPATGTQYIIRQNSSNLKYVPVSLAQNTQVAVPVTKSLPKVTQTQAINIPCNLSVRQEEVDPKQIKRQQRMIKNRESACLSRRKKKEYVQNLENKIKEITTEKEKLLQENTILKSRMKTLQQENDLLRSQNPHLTMSVKKSSCALILMLFIVLNFAPFSSLKNSLNEESTFHRQFQSHHGRALLQFNPDHLANENKMMHSKSFESLRDDRTTDKFINQRFYRKKVITQFEENLKKAGMAVQNSSQPHNQSKDDLENAESTMAVCPTYFNRTEVSRLNGVLEGFVKGHEVDRRSKQLKEKKKSKKVKNTFSKLAEQIASNCTKSKKFSSRISASGKKFWSQSTRHAVQLYNRKESFQNLQQAIKSKDDTFYVISLRRDHLMLPAKEYNETRRPKMSFMMLAPSGNESTWQEPKDYFRMLQIDCEVMDTKMVKLKKTVFPEFLFADSKVFSQTVVNSPFDSSGGPFVHRSP